MRGRRAGAPARARLAAVAPRKTSARKKTRRTKTPSRTRTRKRLVPRKEKRGLEGSDLHLELHGPEVAALVAEVEGVGGVALGAYREPLSGRPLLLASLPVQAVDPTEKAHDLKDRSLEVIRMARELARRRKSARESDFEAEFEAPELLTLGIVYEQQPRFAGGAYSPFLRKVDRFSSKPLPQTLREREGWASRLLAIDQEVKRIVAELSKSGFRSPYLRNYVVARINPVRFHRSKKGERGPAMAMGPALTRMAASARRFDVGSVRERDLALVAAVSGGEG